MTPRLFLAGMTIPSHCPTCGAEITGAIGSRCETCRPLNLSAEARFLLEKAEDEKRDRLRRERLRGASPYPRAVRNWD